MSVQTHDFAHEGHIEVVALQGENGTVHVRTGDNMEGEWVDRGDFYWAPEPLGNFSMREVVVGGTNLERPDKDGTRFVRHAHPVKPTKIHK